MSTKKIETVGIILAGGVGARFGGSTPKQYNLLNNREIISYSIEAFKSAKRVDDFIVVLDEKQFLEGRISIQYDVKTIQGGATRNHSLKNALDYIKKNYHNCSRIVENNAACPLVTSEVLDELVSLLDKNDYVQCTYRITDALGSYKDGIVNREDYYLIQSPNAYNFKLLFDSFDPNNPNAHPAVQLPKDAKGYNYFGFIPNIKITYPHDILVIEAIMNGRKTKN